MLSYKKEKKKSKTKTVKGIKQIDFEFFFTSFLFSLLPYCSDLTGISKVPDLDQIWTLSTDALKQEKKIGFFFVKKEVQMDHTFNWHHSMA